VNGEAVHAVDPLTATLMKVVPFEEFGVYPYALNQAERLVIGSAGATDWARARQWVASERYLIEGEFMMLAPLLDVARRHPGKVPVGFGLVSGPAAPHASRWSRLRRWVRRRRRDQRGGDAVAAQAARLGLSVEDFAAVVLAADRLGWIEGAA
jgi:hypothetical protein